RFDRLGLMGQAVTRLIAPSSNANSANFSAASGDRERVPQDRAFDNLVPHTSNRIPAWIISQPRDNNAQSAVGTPIPPVGNQIPDTDNPFPASGNFSRLFSLFCRRVSLLFRQNSLIACAGNFIVTS
ncbi:hypothetical protein, partial [Mesorhizobium marinum]